MNNFDLIEQIHLRLPLWDRAYIDKTDTNTKEELWDEIAQIMGCSKEILKSRWKNLRDSYRKIIRKSLGRDSDPKWPYYNAMEFMRDITMNARPKIHDITKKSHNIEADYTLGMVRSENEDSIDPLNEGHGHGHGHGHVIKQEKGVKRHAAEDLVTQFLEIESENTQTESEKSGKHLYDDDDYQFLLSLHPHFKQVPITRKLPLRMKIEQLIYDELYNAHNAHNANTSCNY